jgi:ubiquinone/menaquinone biosynthesis C-methylase UbiE
MPDREARFSALLDVVEAVASPHPLVLDLACGTGSITCRLLDRFPDARSIAVDVDPALLSIAGATFAGDDRVRLVRADLAQPGWTAALPDTPVDAVLTATALHWMEEPALRQLFRDLTGVVRPGGAFVNVDHMGLDDLPELSDALYDIERRQRSHLQADGRPDWEAWWRLAATDPLLTEAVAERHAHFGGTHGSSEFEPPSSWHVQALLDAGFAQAGVIWRAGVNAAVAAIR